MATKSIITRIKNKVDSLSAWQSYTGTLLNGEIAVVRVPTGTSYTNPVTGKSEPVIELLMKVGDGSTAFASLPWLSAKASDVYNWAKLETATDIPVTINGTASTLGAYLAKVDTNTANIASNDVDIGNLTAKVDVEKVSTAISAAINALNVSTSSGSGNFVKAVTQSNGKISVTKGTIAESELPNISASKITIDSTTLDDKISAMDAAIADKAASSHGTHVTWSTTTPKANGTASVGSETKVARGDHVHPLQTSVSGNAGSANKVNKAVTFATSNGAATGTTFDGSAAVTVSYNTVGAAAASHSHDDLYYTEAEINAKVQELNTAIDSHNHDSVYITPSAVDSKISTALSSVLKYKGTKNTTSLLPTSGNSTGDVWNISTACAASGTLPAVNAGDNVAWNGSSWDVLAGTIDLSNYYTESEVDAKLLTKSDTDHTHNYAGSTSAGGAANSVKAALTFSTSGDGDTNGTTYNGGTARKISYNSVGAAPATHSHTKDQISDFAHNHDDSYYTESEIDAKLAEKSDTGHTHAYLPDTTTYAGSSTKGGPANSVSNALTVKLNGGTAEGTNMFTFNGSAAKTVNVTAGGVGAYTKAETDSLLAAKQDSGDYAPSSHAHGNITNSGTITSSAVTTASGVVVVDSSSKVQKVTDMSTFRTIIGAGTSSLTLGTTATTAAKGNHTHSTYEADITAIKGNYVRVNASNQLVHSVNGADTEIIFDCGGAS